MRGKLKPKGEEWIVKEGQQQVNYRCPWLPAVNKAVGWQQANWRRIFFLQTKNISRLLYEDISSSPRLNKNESRRVKMMEVKAKRAFVFFLAWFVGLNRLACGMWRKWNALLINLAGQSFFFCFHSKRPFFGSISPVTIVDIDLWEKIVRCCSPIVFQLYFLFLSFIVNSK